MLLEDKVAIVTDSGGRVGHGPTRRGPFRPMQAGDWNGCVAANPGALFYRPEAVAR